MQLKSTICHWAIALLVLCGMAFPAMSQSTAVVTGTERMVIRSGDLVDVKVFREDELSGRMRVSSDGEINLPLVGMVRIGGMSPEQASTAIKGKLADGYLVHPDVLVTVADYARQLFTVMGQVQKPGTYEMPIGGRVSLLQAIGQAGGFTRIANASKVIIKRKVAGRDEVFTVNVKRLSRETDTPDVQLRAGDVITIPESLF